MNKNFVVVAVLPSELDEAQSHTLGKLLRGVNCRMESFVIAPSGDLGGCIDELIQKTLHLMEREGRPVLLLHPPLVGATAQRGACIRYAVASVSAVNLILRHLLLTNLHSAAHLRCDLQLPIALRFCSQMEVMARYGTKKWHGLHRPTDHGQHA